jgi:16S rRNA (guanine1207-N2)-methyltransferase
MSLLEELPFVVPPEMAALYRAAWPSSDLLAEAASSLAADARVLLLGCAADPLALLVARRVVDGECVVADDDAATGQRLEAFADTMELGSLRVVDPAELVASTRGDAFLFDAAVASVMFHSSKQMTARLLRLAHDVTRPGASIYAAGAKDRGMPSITDEMRRLFGNVAVAGLRKGHRVSVSVRGVNAIVDESPWPEPGVGGEETVAVRGEPLVLAVSPLVFAGARLDPAAAMLAEAMEVPLDKTVVDLGCGAGVVGLVAARLATDGHVYLLDSSHAAVRTVLVNAKRNGIGNVTALVGDGPTMLREQGLHPDIIVSNPPFHSGQVEARQVAARFIGAAAACLPLRGRLYVVANRFLRYETVLQEGFEQVAEVAGDAHYKVLLGERPRRPIRAVQLPAHS